MERSFFPASAMARDEPPKGDVNYGYWRIAHLLFGAYHLFIGIYVFLEFEKFIDNTQVDVYVRVPEINIVEDGDDKIFEVTADKKRILGSVSPIFIHALVSCFTAASHWASFFFYKVHGLKRYRPNPIRWVEYSITATLMTFSGFIGIGHGDLFFLLSICFLGVILQYCGYKVEETAVRGQWRPYFYVGTFIEIAIALPLIYGTSAASREEGGFGLVILLICYILYYSSFAINAFWDAAYLAPEALSDKTALEHEMMKKEDRAKNNQNWMIMGRQQDAKERQKSDYADPGFMITDERYAVLSLTSKTALFWITVGTLMYEVDDHDRQDLWLSVIWSMVGVPAVLLAIFLLYQTWNLPSWAKTFLSYASCAQQWNDSKTRDFYAPDSSRKRNITDNLNRSKERFRLIATAPPGTASDRDNVPTLRF